MHRFFTESEIIDGFVQISGGDVKHIKDVLRIVPGDNVEVVTGQKAYLCEIAEINKNFILTRVIEKIGKRHESPVTINLFQGLPKSTKLETILQKCTEIGVNGFFPLITTRTIVKLSDDKKESKKLERWNSIVQEAAKQSKRDVIPEVNNVISFKDIEGFLGAGFTIVPYESSEGNGIKEVLRSFERPEIINIVIGPEGGFEIEEIQRLSELGAHIVSLGPRILRTETAGMVTAAVIQYEYGDLGVM